MLEHLVRRLNSFSALSEPEIQTVRALFIGGRRVSAGDDIAREGEVSASVSVLLEGLACRFKTMPDGRRQIMGFLLPGDLVDLYGYIQQARHGQPQPQRLVRTGRRVVPAKQVFEQ